MAAALIDIPQLAQSPPNEQQLHQSQHQISNEKPLTVPYTSRIPGGNVNADESIIIRGTVLPSAKHFEINLLNGVSGPNQPPNAIPKQIVLHICFHFDVGISVLNTYLDGDWGYEECHGNPFKAGAEFELAIHVQEEKYEFSVNGKRLADYPHRVSYSNADYIQAKGDILLSSICYGGDPCKSPLDLVSTSPNCCKFNAFFDGPNDSTGAQNNPKVV